MEISTEGQNSAGTGLTDLLDNGFIEIRTGSSPGVNSSATGTLLATLNLSATAFATWSSGSGSANAISDDTSADATGTAGYFRAYKNGVTPGNAGTIDGTVSATGGGGELQLNSTSVTAGATVEITSWSITMPAS